MDELKHYGVKGMKWGVRRTPEQLGNKPIKRVSNAVTQSLKNLGERKSKEKKTKGESKRPPEKLTDAELSACINRLNMEERYSELVARKNARETSAFTKAAREVLGNGLKEMGRQTMNWMVGKAMDRITGKKEGYEIDDPDSASTEKLRKSTDWIRAKREYENAKREYETVKKSGNSSAMDAEMERYKKETAYLNAKKEYEKLTSPSSKGKRTEYSNFDYRTASDDEVRDVLSRLSKENQIVKLLEQMRKPEADEDDYV